MTHYTNILGTIIDNDSKRKNRAPTMVRNNPSRHMNLFIGNNLRQAPKPVVRQPVARQDVVKQPVVEQPVVEEPVVEEPVVEETCS